jgi:predicted nucleic-acid-binding protein
MTLVDTNILLRFILKDDIQMYNEAKRILENHDDLFIVNEVIAEAIYVLTKSYNIPRVNSANLFIEIINENIFQLSSKEIIIKALEIFSSKNLDFIDCILCATSRLTENRVET